MIFTSYEESMFALFRHRTSSTGESKSTEDWISSFFLNENYWPYLIHWFVAPNSDIFCFFRESLDRMRCLSCRRTSKNAREFPSFSRISYLAEVERKEDLTCPMFGTKVSNINSPIGTCHFIPHNFLLFHWSDVHLRPEGPNDGVRWGTPDSYLEYSLSVFSLPKLKHFGVYTFKSPNQSLHIGITGSSSNFAFRFGLVGFIGVGFLHSEIRRTTNQI